jgi:hypothetical protein
MSFLDHDRIIRSILSIEQIARNGKKRHMYAEVGY